MKEIQAQLPKENKKASYPGRWMWSRIFYDSSGKGWSSGDRYRSDTGYDQERKAAGRRGAGRV